ncbi:DUF4238 domain-containing protein [Pannonibacter phragmitetus]|uniref:DUF4238 domain-containing protein n=1 Tax=Pannonibacter phragmitetus TaxID=121719 RepID=UPI003D2F3AFE
MACHKADLEENLDILSKIKDVRIKGNNVVSDVIYYSAFAYKLLMDLDIVLIKNESNTRFISSDAPLVLHNRLYEDQDISCIGYANVGLQLFLPLGPQLAIFGFDRGAYKVEYSESGLVKVNDDEQIFLINDLQWEAAHSVLLVSSDTPEQILQESANIWSSRRGAERTVSREEIVYRTENEAKMRYGSGAAPSKVALNLPFVTCTLPKPARLGPWEVPPLRDASRASLLFES